jgi:small-conductance mechanosensitive channel
MRNLLALTATLGITALIIGAVFYLRRSLTLIRQLTFVLIVGAVAVGLATYKLSGVTLPPEVDQGFTALLAFLAVIVILRLIGIYIFDIHLRANRGVQLPPLLAPVAQTLVYLVAAFIILKVNYQDMSLAPLFATSAVTSLVIGLALQPILTNLIAGVVIAIEKPFRLNDWIKVGDIEGRIVEITWRTTHLRTRDNDNLILPNGKISEERILNYYYPNPMHMARVWVGAHYSAPPYRVRRALLESVPGIQGTLEKPTPDVQVRNFQDSAIEYELRVWIKDIADVDRIKSDLRACIWESFKRHGITIPYPIRTIEVAPRARATSDPARAPQARLFVSDGSGAGVTIPLSERPSTIGRAQTCDVQLADAQASKEHARITWDGATYIIEDLGSSFGTLVNGEKVDRRRLQPLDRIAIGGTVMVFEADGT